MNEGAYSPSNTFGHKKRKIKKVFPFSTFLSNVTNHHQIIRNGKRIQKQTKEEEAK